MDRRLPTIGVDPMNPLEFAILNARTVWPTPRERQAARIFAQAEAQGYPLPDPESPSALEIHVQNFAEMRDDLRLIIAQADPSEIAPLVRLVEELEHDMTELLLLVYSRQK